MAVVEPFVTQGQCPWPECEVTLKFKVEDEDKHSYLYVCKHSLARAGEFFERMFLGNFKEKHEGEIEIQDISRSAMLLFLRFAVPVENYKAPKPADATELYSLISLADRFIYPQLCQDIAAQLAEWASSWSPDVPKIRQLISLGERLMCNDLNEIIAEHILCTPAMYGESSEVKLDLVQTAYMHQGGSTVILEACIRLCANIDLWEVEKLQRQGLDGVMLAIYAIIAEATPRISDAPKHTNRQCCTGTKKFDGLTMTSGRRWWWRCSKCNTRQEATLPFQKIKQLEVNVGLASVDKAMLIDKPVTVDKAIQTGRSLTLHDRTTIVLGDSSDDEISLQPSVAQKKAIQVKRRLSQQVAVSKLKHAAGAKTTPTKNVPAASKATVSSIETLRAGLTRGSPNALTEAQKRAIENKNVLLLERMRKKLRSLMKARVQHKHTSPRAVDEQLEAFKRKWVSGPSRGCPEQNDHIEQIYELCRVEGMNSHDTAHVKRALAKFLHIQKDSLAIRLKHHRKRRENKATVQELALVAKARRPAVALAKSQASVPQAPKPTLAKPPTVPNTITHHVETTPPSIDYSNLKQGEILGKLRKALRLCVPFMEQSYEVMVNKWRNDCKLGINKPKPARKWNWTDELIALVTASISNYVGKWESFQDDPKRKRAQEMCLMNFCQQKMVPLWNEIAPGWMNEKLLLHATRSVHCKYTEIGRTNQCI